MESAEKQGSFHLPGSILLGSELAETVNMINAQRRTGSQREMCDFNLMKGKPSC